MKAFIKSIQFWLIFIALATLVLALVFSCSSTPSADETTSGGGGAGDRANNDDDDAPKRGLECELPKCSGSECCDKIKDEDSRKENCENWCKDGDYLGLNGDAYRACLALEHSFVDKLSTLFGEEGLKDPNEEELSNLKTEDLDKICSAVRELDVDVWGDTIDDYSGSEARVVLAWIAGTDDTIDIFEKIKKKEDSIEIFRVLLSTLSSGDSVTDQTVVNGLAESVDFDEKEYDNVMVMALEKDNYRLVDYIDKKIIKDKNEGLCGKDQSNNWPKPKPKSGTSGYASADIANANNNQQRACILAVYCNFITQAETDNPKDKIRKQLEDRVSSTDMRSFIKNPVTKGGLGLTASDSDKWPNTVCIRLKRLWNNPSKNFDLRLD